MNKKFRNFLALTIMILVTILLTSCFEGAPETFEIVSLPKTSYVLNEEFDWDGLKVKLNGVDHVINELNDLTRIGIAVYPAELSTASEGIKSVTLSYGSLTATFQYTVYKTIFAGGDGSKENPYQISTIEQFYQITFNKEEGETNPFEDNYFEIINDIDFNNNVVDFVNYQKTIKNIHIDGNNYTFRNLSSRLFTNILANKKNGTTIENLNLDFKSGGLGIAAYTELTGEGEVIFKNINVYGKAILGPDGQNAGAFIGHIKGDDQSTQDSVYFIDCDNHMNIVGESPRAGVFIGGFAKNANVYFQNCKNYATLEGDSISLLVGNNSEYQTSTFYIDEDTVNFGTIVASTNASDFIAGPTKVLLENAPNVRVLLSDGTSVPYNEYTGIWEINKGELIEVFAEGMTLSRDATTKRLAMTLSTDARVASYKLFVTYWGNTYHDVERHNLIGTNTVILYKSNAFTTVEHFNALPINFAYRWINTTGEYMSVQSDNYYVFTDENVLAYVDKEEVLNVTYLLYAYDTEGNILGVSKIAVTS